MLIFDYNSRNLYLIEFLNLEKFQLYLIKFLNPEKFQLYLIKFLNLEKFQLYLIKFLNLKKFQLYLIKFQISKTDDNTYANHDLSPTSAGFLRSVKNCTV